MKITMIGDRGCGKTTFMAGLYRSMTDPNFCLNIRLSNKEQRKHVDSIANNLSHNSYPLPTDFAQTYEFDFTVDNVKLLDFTWYDYRGGALEEDASSNEVVELFDQINSSDGLIVFADTTTMDHPKWKKNRYWRTIQQAVINFASQVDQNNKRSLGFVFTKFDSKPDYPEDPGVYDKFFSLIDQMPNHEYLWGIAANTAITKDISLNTIEVFLRIMTPFIYQALQEQAYKIDQTNEMNELLHHIGDNYNSAGFLDDFFSGLFGESSVRDQVTACVNMLKQYPLYQSSKRRLLISSFLNHWNSRSVFDDLGTAFFGGRSQSSIAEQEFGQIIDIWVNYANDIGALYGTWSENFMKYLDENSGKEDSFYFLF